MARRDGRKKNEIRPLKVHKRYIESARESVLIESGHTRVICTATVDDHIPQFLKGSGRGWVTAEYGMLPRSSPSRIPRESVRGRVKGRTHEIQRMIGRALRMAVDLAAIGERTIVIDCDVIEADGGTRTASINGGFLVLAEALRGLGIERKALLTHVAAVSVGIVDGGIMLDLDYSEDSRAEVDLNVVMNDKCEFIEIQGTAEGKTFSEERFGAMIKSAKTGIRRIIREQKRILR